MGGCFYTFQIMFVYMGAFILLSNTTFRHLRQPSKSFEAQAKAFKASNGLSLSQRRFDFTWAAFLWRLMRES